MIVIWIAFCLFHCFAIGFDEFFELTSKFPEMNAQLKKQQILFTQKIKNVLNSNNPEKTKYNSPYDDCVRLKNRTTIINDVEVKFHNIQICGMGNHVLLDFEPQLEYGAVSFKYRFNRLYLKLNSVSQNVGSQVHQHNEELTLVMENVFVDGASGVEVDQQEALWKTSTWTQDVTQEKLYLERGHGGPSSIFKLNDSILTSNTIGRLFKYESYRLINQELKEQIDAALETYPISDLFNSQRLLSQYKSQVLGLSKFANKFIDNLLDETRTYIRSNNQQIASIPDFETKFSKDWGLLTVWGEIAATRGYVSDLSTLTRTANFTILPMRKAKMLKVFGALGLETLEFGYSDYEASIWNVGPKGKINAETGKNSIAFYFKGGLDPKKGTLDVRMFDVNIVEFENTKIRATGLGPLNYLYSMALSRIADNAKDEVLPIVETELSNMIQQQIESGLTFSGFETYAN